MCAALSRRRFDRFVLAERPDRYSGSMHVGRVSDDRLYTLGQGGAGFICSVKDQGLQHRETVITAFKLRDFRSDPIVLEGKIRYIRKQTIEGKSRFLYGIEFIDANNPDLMEAITHLRTLSEKGEISVQPVTK